MNPNFNFVWIDDTRQREASAKSLASHLGVTVLFVCVEQKDIQVEISNLLSRAEPDLVIMDHSLHKANIRIATTGSSLAALVREKWQRCPIISVTAVTAKQMDIRHRAAYEAIIPFDKIGKNYSRIAAIAIGFASLKQNAPTNLNDLLATIGAPEDDHKRLTKILPNEIKDFDDPGHSLHLFRWCNEVLFERPGFLYDRLWASTYLGLSSSAFKTVENKFEQARYQGVFANLQEPRWWKSGISSHLGEITNSAGLPWVLGRTLVEPSVRNYSQCYASEESYPETIAAVDDTESAEWHPMKLKYTKPHPRYDDLLFFEEARMMAPENLPDK